MARKRSRISDTPIVQESQARQSSSALEEGDADRDCHGQEHDGGGDEDEDDYFDNDNYDNNDSPPATRSTQGLCRKCGEAVGEFYNSWHKVTNTYYLPALLGSYNSRLQAKDKIKAASVGSVLNGW